MQAQQASKYYTFGACWGTLHRLLPENSVLLKTGQDLTLHCVVLNISLSQYGSMAKTKLVN
jgi:hypothetical protein